MRKVLFGTIVVLSVILTSCETAKTEETKTTEDSTKVVAPVEATTVTTPSVDSAKVEK